ncbi:hypothetical protein Syun_016614 [Stephania yunnanensis]|uniref:SKP1 component dimerisation domain-containing protein n=1 Tax=Stephania yunnanensis TaxID=152371 RepID=A0AAP0J7S7_9MAGN
MEKPCFGVGGDDQRNLESEFGYCAANYLDINGLLDLTCQAVADLLKGMSVEEVRKLFNIENDFTPEEEEAVRKENQWAFE